MSLTIKVDEIENPGGVNLPVETLKRRMVQRFTRTFKGGIWNPGNTYYEIPGSFINITPLYDDSVLVYTYSGAVSWINGWNNHSISHWRFYVNGQEYARHNKSTDWIEENAIVKWEVPSWGAGASGSMGYYARQYNNGNHGVHFNARHYRDRSRVQEPVNVYISVEEFTNP